MIEGGDSIDEPETVPLFAGGLSSCAGTLNFPTCPDKVNRSPKSMGDQLSSLVGTMRAQNAGALLLDSANSELRYILNDNPGRTSLISADNNPEARPD